MHEAPTAEVPDLVGPEDAPIRTERPLPWKTVIVLGIVILSDSISGTVIFPFQGFMVDDFHIAASTSQVGYYAGFLGSSYFIAQIFCSYFYGWLSDRLGRRPVLLFGLCGSTLSILMLGISPNIYWAVGWRFANGILNGNVGVAKTYMAEITDETNQARGFGALSLIWNLGNILGPVIGGFLARPHLQAPWKYIIAEDSLLGGRYPYLLPCIVAAACTTFGFVMGVLFLPETLKRNQPPQDRAAAQRSSDAETLLEDGEARAALSDSSTGSSSSLDLAASAPTAKPSTLLEWIKGLQIVHLLSRRKVVVAVGLYMILGFADVMFEEVFPLWSLNKPQLGGLGFLPFNIGMTTAIGSLLLLAWNAFGYPLLEAKFRPLGCFQLAYSIIVPALIVYPSVHYLVPFGTVILWAGVMAATFTYFIASSTAYMSVFILIANCAPSQNLSRVNGVAQTGVAIGRTISPILGGSLLAWSLNNGLTYPLNFYFVFGFMAFAHACGACLSFLLPPTINERAPLSELVT